MYSDYFFIALGGLRDFVSLRLRQFIFCVELMFLCKKSCTIQTLKNCKDFPIWQVVDKLSFILALSVLILCYFHLDLSLLV